MKAATSSARFGIGDRPVDVGGAAVALELERIDLVGLGELRDDRAHGRDVHVGAVQHDQRLALAGHLVVHLHAVDLDALTRRFGPDRGGPLEQAGEQGGGERPHRERLARAAAAKVRRRPASRFARRISGRFSTNPGSRRASGEQRIRQRVSPGTLTYCAGMIWSVSTIGGGHRHQSRRGEVNGVMLASIAAAARVGRGSATVPCNALAAADSGLIRNVRAPGPCRSLEIAVARACDVLAEARTRRSSPRTGCSPGAPIRRRRQGRCGASPSASACRRTACEPCHHEAAAHPARSCARAAGRRHSRKSSMRELVHDPMNTTSSGGQVFDERWPGTSSM